MKKSTGFAKSVMTKLFKISLCVLLFPYQIVINRSEEKFSVRSLLAALFVEKKVGDDGKKKNQIYISIPGCEPKGVTAALKKLFSHFKTKKVKIKDDSSPKEAVENAEYEDITDVEDSSPETVEVEE